MKEIKLVCIQMGQKFYLGLDRLYSWLTYVHFLSRSSRKSNIQDYGLGNDDKKIE